MDATPPHREVPRPPGLTPAETECLSQLAGRALRRVLLGTESVDPAASKAALGERLTACGRVFVTIYRGDQLRGCIGLVKAEKPLWEATVDMVLAAATRDPRFEPLAATELPELRLEISVLGPMVELDAISGEPDGRARLVVPGTHGVYVSRGRDSGLLLPQVAESFGWDAIEFLEQACIKAGLDPDSWTLSDTRVFLFRTTRIESEVASGG